jgi:poly-gamma-glutamate synthesis protein (capsule biosynthesis protein)
VQLGDGGVVSVTHASDADARLRLTWSQDEGGEPVFQETFAAATRFDAIFPEITWDGLNASWQGDVTTYTVVAILTDTMHALEQVLGEAGPTVHQFASVEEVVAASWAETPTLALLPFEELQPRLVVLAVDGQNPVENANKFDADAYPLVASLYAVSDEEAADQPNIAAALASIPPGNRDPNKLTVLVMTGVTAMVRMMADEMDRRGAAWPAEYVGAELSSADITHISNEVPFVEGCETDVNPENFNFCTKPEYLETLRLSGVDIIGLTGNHQNDYGLKNALASLDFYEQEGLPVYGGGRNKQEAFAPLYVTHNGNRLAFLGANSYGPPMAWAEDDSPGSAEFDLNIMSATIRAIREKNLADVVLPELQYQESYDVSPLFDQREDFNALIRAGADIVTGVQSHVPQAIEFTDGKLILYGLGNLYFDQMYSQSTRENLIARHTIYDGRHISTQLLTTLLYDFGQPRWMTPDERESLLRRVFKASYWE